MREYVNKEKYLCAKINIYYVNEFGNYRDCVRHKEERYL